MSALATEWAVTEVTVDPRTVYECKLARQGKTYRLKSGEMLNASDPKLGTEDTSCSWNGYWEWIKMVEKKGREVWGHENILEKSRLSLPHWEDYAPIDMIDYMEQNGWTFQGDTQWYREWVLTEEYDEPSQTKASLLEVNHGNNKLTDSKRRRSQKTSLTKKK